MKYYSLALFLPNGKVNIYITKGMKGVLKDSPKISLKTANMSAIYKIPYLQDSMLSYVGH